MNLHIHNFRHNSPKDIGDIITSISYDQDPSGIIRVRFTTKDKYYSVDGEWPAHTMSYKGQGLEFMPYIYDGNSYLDPYDESCDENLYYDHPDWWMLKLVLETDKYYESKVIALKHEYLWVLIPQDIVFRSYDKMKPLKVMK